jgi:hypothetical protein
VLEGFLGDALVAAVLLRPTNLLARERAFPFLVWRGTIASTASGKQSDGTQADPQSADRCGSWKLPEHARLLGFRYEYVRRRDCNMVHMSARSETLRLGDQHA